MVASVVLQPRADQILQQSPIPALRKLSVEESDHEVVASAEVAGGPAFDCHPYHPLRLPALMSDERVYQLESPGVEDDPRTTQVGSRRDLLDLLARRQDISGARRQRR